MSKRNSPCTNYHKPSDDWRLNDTKPCDYCKEPMIPAPTTKKHLWKKKKYCSSYCSASARSPYASKVLGPLLLALGFLLTAPGVTVAQAPAERAEADAAREREKTKEKTKDKETKETKETKEKTKYSYNPRESYEDTKANDDDECTTGHPPSSVPEPSNPGVLLAVAGAVLLARRARKP